MEEIKKQKSLEELEKHENNLKKQEYKDKTKLKDTRKKDFKAKLKWLWWFIWESNSVWSWIVNIILAFVIIKFLVYPGLGFALQTTHPIVAVVSESMEHDGDFDQWFNSEALCNNQECTQNKWYFDYDISKQEFKTFSFKNGFNKGDIMVLKGTKPENIEIGDVIVYYGRLTDPIIHRIIKITQKDNTYYFQTKGDHNMNQDNIEIPLDKTVGYTKHQKVSKAVFRTPLLGYIKIGFVKLISPFTG